MTPEPGAWLFAWESEPKKQQSDQNGGDDAYLLPNALFHQYPAD